MIREPGTAESVPCAAANPQENRIATTVAQNLREDGHNESIRFAIKQFLADETWTDLSTA